MTSNSNPFPLSSSVPIRAPLTLDLDDSEFDTSSNVSLSLSDTAFNSESAEEEDEVDECAQLPPMHAPPSRVTPFAHLSAFDDDDDKEDEEDLLSAAPRVKLLDSEEENPESLSFMNSLPVSQSLLANMGSDNDEEAYDEYSSDSDVMSQYSQDNFSNMARVVLNETHTTVQGMLEVDTRETTQMLEATSIVLGDTTLFNFNIEDCKNTIISEENVGVLEHLQKQNLQEHCIAGEPVSEGFGENVEFSAPNGRQESECENLVSTTTSVVNSMAQLHHSSAGFESNYDVCEGNRILSVESSQLFDSTLLRECAYLEKDLSKTILVVSLEDELLFDYHSHQNLEILNLGNTVKEEAVIELNTASQESKKDGYASDGDVEGLMSVDLEQFREQISALSILLGSEGSRKNSEEEQTVRSSHGTKNLPKDDAKSQLICVDNGVETDGRSDTVISAVESSVTFLKDPAGISSLPHFDAQAGFKHCINEKEKEKIQKIQIISVKFLRLVQRINLSPEDSLVSKVLCRLVADIGRRSNQEFVIKSAKTSAKKLEEDCQDDLDFSLNILVLGKSGVGKSATINSIFGDMKVMTDAFEPATTSVKEISGTIDGVKIRVIDTPGLKSSIKEQAYNRKILSSVNWYMKKFSPDVILYVDRVDAQTRDLSDLPILRSITSSLGPSIWKNAILTLTHAASTPLDGPSGSPLSYEVFVAQKSYLVQRSITQAVGDLCEVSPSFMCPVALVENHPLCGKNMSGDCVLPNGLRWRSQLLALCFSLKILSDVSSVSGPQTLFDHWKHFFFQDNSQPLCHIFSSLLQSPAHLKFSANWS